MTTINPAVKRLIALCTLFCFLNSSYAQENVSMAFDAKHFDSILLKKSQLGLRLSDISVFVQKGRKWHAAAWNKSASADVQLRFLMNAATFNKTIKEFKEKGYRPGRISTIEDNGSVERTVLFCKATADWFVEYDLSDGEFRERSEKNTRKGYGLVDVCIYSVKGDKKFSTVWEKGANSFHKEYSMDEIGYQSEDQSQGYRSFVPVRISGFKDTYMKKYAAVWMPNKTEHHTLLGLTTNMLIAECKHAEKNNRQIKALNVVNENSKLYYDVVFEGPESYSLASTLRNIKTDAWKGFMALGNPGDIKKLEAAKSAIDGLERELCCNWLSGFWWAKWETYSAIVKTEELNAKYPDAASHAASGIINYEILEPEIPELRESGGYRFSSVYNSLSKYAFALYKQKDYASAFREFRQLVDISDIMIQNKWHDKQFDTSAYYLAAYTGRLAEDEACVEYYERIADKEVGGDKYFSVYTFVTSYYAIAKDTENYKKYMAISRRLYPGRSKDLDEIEKELKP